MNLPIGTDDTRKNAERRVLQKALATEKDRKQQRARGLSVTTTSDGMCNSSDADQLAFASSRNLVLVTFNITDFALLHRETLANGRCHAGIIVVRQKRWGPGELARRIIRTLVIARDQDIRDRLEFII